MDEHLLVCVPDDAGVARFGTILAQPAETHDLALFDRADEVGRDLRLLEFELV